MVTYIKTTVGPASTAQMSLKRCELAQRHRPFSSALPMVDRGVTPCMEGGSTLQDSNHMTALLKLHDSDDMPCRMHGVRGAR